MTPIQEVIQRLQNNPDVTLRPGAGEAGITALEGAYGVTLPGDFKEFYRISDGFETGDEMFNLIPLADMNEDAQKYAGELCIAEYMIYCDMWYLQVNPADADDYEITVYYNNNKLTLTRSLAEFIDRFLDGGVLGNGGLYDQAEQVEQQPIYSTQLKTAESLLTAFYYGLCNGIVSADEVIGWANEIIEREYLPEQLFEQMATAYDAGDLIDLLSPVSIPNTDITARALLSFLHKQLKEQKITTEKAMSVLSGFRWDGLLTRGERNLITEFISRSRKNGRIFENEKFARELYNFLSSYASIEIANYKNWYGIGEQIKYEASMEG